MFASTGSGILARDEHVNLLWALETVSWNPDYFERVVRILFRLLESFDGMIPSNHANRPKGSLVELFLPWQRNSSVEIDERLRILKSMSIEFPESVFVLIGAIMEATISSRIALPKYRDWSVSDDFSVQVQEYARFSG